MTDDNVIQFRLKDRFKKACYSETDFRNGNPKNYFKDLEDDGDRLLNKLIETVNGFIADERISADAFCIASGVGKFAAVLASIEDETHRECILSHLDAEDPEPVEEQDASTAVIQFFEDLERDFGRDNLTSRMAGLRHTHNRIQDQSTHFFQFRLDGEAMTRAYIVHPATDFEAEPAPPEIAVIAEHLSKRTA